MTPLGGPLATFPVEHLPAERNASAHTCAMHTLMATGDVRKVALWLGHARLQSTEACRRADPTEKLEALAATVPPSLTPGRFRPPDKLLAMLASPTHACYAR